MSAASGALHPSVLEFASSEKSYLDSLRNLESVVCRVPDKWFPADNLLGIPSHDICDILLVNENLLHAWSSPGLTLQSLAQSFTEFCAVATYAYKAFIDHYAYREEQFRRLKENNSDDPAFHTLYSMIGDKIILPIQRVMRYPMLFDAAIGALRGEGLADADLEPLRAANAVALKFASLCDDAQSQSAKFILLKQVGESQEGNQAGRPAGRLAGRRQRGRDIALAASACLGCDTHTHARTRTHAPTPAFKHAYKHARTRMYEQPSHSVVLPQQARPCQPSRCPLLAAGLQVPALRTVLEESRLLHTNRVFLKGQ
jgi:hypothetical protein